MKALPPPEPGRAAAEAYVTTHLRHVVPDHVQGSPTIRGGQRAADEALRAFDIAGYASKRNEVYPASRRGASRPAGGRDGCTATAAVTFAPVPGFRTRAEAIQPVELHPWPWLVAPNDGSVASFSAWRRSTHLLVDD